MAESIDFLPDLPEIVEEKLRGGTRGIGDRDPAWGIEGVGDSLGTTVDVIPE